jgi:hypothetical protein
MIPNAHPQVELKRKCFASITRIAARGAASWDPDDVHYTLQELGYFLKKYLDQDIPSLHEELEAFRPTSDSLTAYDMLDFAIRSTWN